jgi:hypothetical protein
LVLLERVNEAQRMAVRELKEIQAQDPKNKKRRRDGDSHNQNADDGEDGDYGDGDDDAEDYTAKKKFSRSNRGNDHRRSGDKFGKKNTKRSRG